MLMYCRYGGVITDLSQKIGSGLAALLRLGIFQIALLTNVDSIGIQTHSLLKRQGDLIMAWLPRPIVYSFIMRSFIKI